MVWWIRLGVRKKRHLVTAHTASLLLQQLLLLHTSASVLEPAPAHACPRQAHFTLY